MIHKYKLGDYNIVLDVNSGGVHVVDELTYDMLDNVAPPFAPECPEEVVTKLSRFYDPEEVRSCYAEILEAYQEGILFSPDDYEKYANFAVASPIKAMCLNIAHDCNLRCKYCFASTGDFGEGRKLMSYETGKKAVDFLLQNSGDRVNLEMDFFGGEPLMNFPVVKRLVEYGRSIEKEKSITRSSGSPLPPTACCSPMTRLTSSIGKCPTWYCLSTAEKRSMTACVPA